MNAKSGVMLATLGLALLSAWAEPPAAQRLPGLDSIRKKVDSYSVQRLIRGESPITTSLSDAVTEVPFLDDYDPNYGIPLSVLPQDKNGRFSLIRPGLYTYSMQSYCLRAGTYGPGKGDGYLYAPLKGKQSPLIRFILQRSTAHPEISQGDIQVLIWAILSKTRISSMSASNQRTALCRDDHKCNGRFDDQRPALYSGGQSCHPRLERRGHTDWHKRKGDDSDA